MKNRIQKKYGLLMTISMVIGVVIGSGIFFKADDIISLTGGNLKLAMIGFLIVGIGAILGAYVISIYLNDSENKDGMIAYGKTAYGRKFGFIVGWFMISIYFPTLVVVIAIALGVYITSLFSIESNLIIFLIACISIFLIYLNNIYKPISGGHVQTITTIIKIIPLILIGIIGTHSYLNSSQSTTDIISSNIEPSFFTALIAIAFAFDGWIIATSISAEVKNRKRNLPLALIIGVSAVMVLYMIFFFGIINISSVNVAINAEDQLIYNVGYTIFGKLGAYIMTLFIIISVYGGLNGTILGYIRLPYTLVDQGLMKDSYHISKLNKKSNVSVASALVGVPFIVLFLVIQAYSSINGTVLNNISFDVSAIPIISAYILYIILYIGVIKLIKKYKLSKFNYLAIVGAIIGALIIVIGSIGHGGIYYSVISLVITAIGLIFYKK